MTDTSLRDALKAAMNPEPEVGTPEPVAAPEPVAEAAPAVKDAPKEDTPEPEPKTGAERDEQGRFKAAGKTGEPQAEPEPKAATEPEAPQPEEPIRVPPSLPAALKAEFKNLDPKWRDFLVKRDEDVNAFRQAQETKAARLNRLDEILAPHKEAWALQGLDDHQALTKLVAAEKVLRENPTQGLLYLAQSYGVDLRQLVQPTGQQPGQPQPYGAQQAPDNPLLNPALQPVLAEIETLKSALAKQEEAASQASTAAAVAQINEFASNPANMYFDNVKDDVAARLESGRAKTLAEAYEQAIWAHHEIRPLLIKEQTAAIEAKAREEAARAKAAAAKAASVSVVGAPTPGAAPVNVGPQPSLREELAAQMKAARA